MRSNRSVVVFGVFVVAAGLLFSQRTAGATHSPTVIPSPALDLRNTTAKTETAVFAGGCFWGIQSVFQHVKGVTSATSGYAGGRTNKPSYDEVSSGETGHAESVRVVFDPSVVSYGDLLKVFFSVAHDPTELNRQGPDVGTQYRSALFYTSDAQKQTAEAYIKQLNDAHVYSRPIVTQVAPFKAFFTAEAYHQNYAEEHPTQPYIAIYDAPKVVNLKKQFPALYTEKLAAHD
jgi:peptide-methionine (S)-S-oxide reductase